MPPASATPLANPAAVPARTVLSRAECWRRLQDHHEGRVHYLSGRGPRAVVVNVKPAFDGLLMHLASFNDATHYIVDRPVSVEVDGADGPAGRWAITVTGVGCAVPEPQVKEAGLADGFETWPDGVPAGYYYVPATSVFGVQDRRAA